MFLISMMRRDSPPRLWFLKLLALSILIGGLFALGFSFFDLEAIGSIKIETFGKTSEVINTMTISSLLCGSYITPAWVGIISGLTYAFFELLAFTIVVMRLWKREGDD